jgi:hypothetical protein
MTNDGGLLGDDSRITAVFGIRLRDRFEQKGTEETEKKCFVFSVSSVNSIEVRARKN